MRKKILIAAGIILGLIVVGYFALPLVTSKLGSVQTKSLYQTEAAKLGNLTAYVGATGSMRANQSAKLLWQASGKVGNVKVQKGQVVEANAVLADLVKTSLAQNIITAQSDLAAAKRDLEKVMNNSEARVNAELAVIQAQRALDDAQKESQSKLYQRASQETIDISKANLITANEALDRAE